MAKAIQVSRNTGDGGSNHVVGVGDLRVLIVCESQDEWYAQGLEIDYLAQGTSMEDVKTSFEIGLEKTIEQHLVVYGSVDKLLQPASPEVWHDFLLKAASDASFSYSTVSTHDLDVPSEEVVFTASTERPKQTKRPAAPKAIPFKKIHYFAQQCA
jgi:hypothetical protein